MKTEKIPLSLVVCLYTFSLCLAQEGITVTTPAGTQHEMVLVPEGEFSMGHTYKYHNDYDVEPEHQVYLDTYYIDKYELTNALYQVFIQATTDKTHRLLPRDAQDIRFSGPQQPVVGVNWYDAVAYCEWVGLRLPTEAEWEKAARGSDNRIYPWGEHWVEFGGNYLGEKDGYTYTAPVGSFPAGVSPYGAYDMAGNVAEWVKDRWSLSYYSQSPYRNPQGPEENPAEWSGRVRRGGAWFSSALQLVVWDRHGGAKQVGYNHTGFRCARDGTPTAVTPETWGKIKSRSP